MNMLKIGFVVMTLIIIVIAIGGVAFMITEELKQQTPDDITLEENDIVGYRFTDISEKGFDCKTIMWYGGQMTCVDWDGVRE